MGETVNRSGQVPGIQGLRRGNHASVTKKEDWGGREQVKKQKRNPLSKQDGKKAAESGNMKL